MLNTQEMKATRGADCLSLLERLEGWTVERRPRDYLGIYDNVRQAYIFALFFFPILLENRNLRVNFII